MDLSWLAARPKLELIVVGIGLILDGMLGAWISTQVRAHGLSVWFFLLSGNMSLFVWMYLSRFSKLHLTTASLVFDCIYNLAWFGALIYLGEPITPTRILAVILVVAGISLLGL